MQSRGGARGLFNCNLHRSLATASSHIRMTIFPVLTLIRVSPLVPSMGETKIAVRATIIRHLLAVQICIVKPRKRYVQTHIAMVSVRKLLIASYYYRPCTHLFTAYDDITSTFTIREGAGFEVIFCPKGRSTNIQQKIHGQGQNFF